MTEREGAVTHKGVPRTVVGDVVQVGQKAPGFRLTAQDLSERSMEDYAGTPLLISVVTSLDTGICDAQTRRFSEEASPLKDRAKFLTVSADLPSAQLRWCKDTDADLVEVLSDHMEMNFGNAWGTHVKELRMEQRAIFVVDADGIVRYVEYVPEIAQHPDYDAAMEALRSVVD